MRRVLVLTATLLIFTSACSNGGGSNEPADADGGSGNGRTTSQAEVRVPGAQWTRVEGDVAGGPGAQRIETVAALGDGFIAAGVDVATDSVVAWTTLDGDEWKRVEVEAGAGAVPFGGNGLLPRDVAVSGDRVVIVGTMGSRCDVPSCGRFEMVAWVSNDAGSTWQRADVDRAFVRGAATLVSAVVATSAGFVAVGRTDGPTNEDWEAVVWSSTDGLTWGLAAELPQIAWPMIDVRVAVAGNTIALVADEAVCGDPFANGVFYALSSPFATSLRAWTSDDGGATWTEVPAEELAPLGVHPLPDAPACDDAAAVRALGDDAELSLFSTADAFFVSGVADDGSATVYSSSDFRKWDVGGGNAPFGGAPYEHVEASTIGTAAEGAVAIDVRQLQETEYLVRTWRSPDGASWEQVGDGADLPGPFEPRTDLLTQTLPFEASDVAVNGASAVVVGNLGPIPNELDGALWVSRAD